MLCYVMLGLGLYITCYVMLYNTWYVMLGLGLGLYNTCYVMLYNTSYVMLGLGLDAMTSKLYFISLGEKYKTALIY